MGFQSKESTFFIMLCYVLIQILSLRDDLKMATVLPRFCVIKTDHWKVEISAFKIKILS